MAFPSTKLFALFLWMAAFCQVADGSTFARRSTGHSASTGTNDAQQHRSNIRQSYRFSVLPEVPAFVASERRITADQRPRPSEGVKVNKPEPIVGYRLEASLFAPEATTQS